MPPDIQLDAAQQALIDEMIASGRASSADDAVGQALELLQKREAAWKQLEAEIKKGLDSIDAGRFRPADEVFDRLEAKLRAMIRD